MLELDQYKTTLGTLKEPLEEVKGSLDLAGKQNRVIELEKMMEEPTFWNDAEKAAKITTELKNTKDTVKKITDLAQEYDDIGMLIELAYEEDDEETNAEIGRMLERFGNELETLRMSTLLNGEFDEKNAIVTLHSGAGGTESCDWCEMLYRMYTRWAAAKGYTVDVLDLQDGDEAGIKSVTMQINGLNAYGYMRSEHGIHRLVRISPFDAAGRRHTSFAALEVMPEISDDSEIELRDEDIKMDVYRSSGAGGQKVNKTSSAVRLTHIPTGIVVASQVERSHFQNLENCKNMLRAKLAEIKEREHLEKISDIKGVQMKIEWGSQIRSYVFMPYQLVKDHRTEYEDGNIDNVMNGDLDGFINAYLSMKASE